MKLTTDDCYNLVDALREWEASVGPKELDDGDVGLDYDRYHDLMRRLLATLENKNEITIFWVCESPGTYREGRDYANLRQATTAADLRRQSIVKETFSLTSVTVVRKEGEEKCETETAGGTLSTKKD